MARKIAAEAQRAKAPARKREARGTSKIKNEAMEKCIIAQDRNSVFSGRFNV